MCDKPGKGCSGDSFLFLASGHVLAVASFPFELECRKWEKGKGDRALEEETALKNGY